MTKEPGEQQHELRDGTRRTGISISAVVVVSAVLGLLVLLVIYAGLLAVTPAYFLIHSLPVSKLGLFTAFASATGHMPPILLGLLLLIAAILLVFLWTFLVHKILASGAVPADAPPVRGYTSPAWDDGTPAAEDGSLPYDDEYAAFEETNAEETDDRKVDQYLKQLDAMSPEEIEDFFAH